MNEPTTNGHDGHGATGALGPTAEESPTPTMIRKKLWADFDQALATKREADDIIGYAVKGLSDAIRAIVAEYGKNGFDRSGEALLFAKRKGKDEYYMKSGGDRVEVDV